MQPDEGTEPDAAEAPAGAEGSTKRRRRTRRRSREGGDEGTAGGGGERANAAPDEAADETSKRRRRPRRRRRAARGGAADEAQEVSPSSAEATGAAGAPATADAVDAPDAVNAAEDAGAGREGRSRRRTKRGRTSRRGRRKRKGAGSATEESAASPDAEGGALEAGSDEVGRGDGGRAKGAEEEKEGGPRRRRARREREERPARRDREERPARRGRRTRESRDQETVEVTASSAAKAPKPETPVEKVLLVNAKDPEEVRIALLENGKVEELYVEGADERSATGNVYRGHVQNVEQGIGAAFVDLGRSLTGFLHVSDLPNREPGSSITDLLSPGQEVLVQVTRDSIGKKGPALTARIALPGRYLVLMPLSPRSGVSRRIGRGEVRDRVRQNLAKLEVPEGMGLIVRTAGEEGTYEDLKRDLDHLVQEWRRLEVLAAQGGPPSLLRSESDVAERAIRDIMPTDAVRIVVDREDLAARIRSLLGAWYGPIPRPRLYGEETSLPAESAEPAEAAAAEPVEPPASVVRAMPEVAVPDDPMPLFHAYDVESQLEEAFRRSLRLPSGGSIVIDPTEALVSIDVNSGRFTEETDPEATALHTNLEAVDEVARQLRLRDLGGLVVVDLIDMRSHRAVKSVEKAFQQALARDRARIRLGRIGPFGCIMLSRQRVRQALSRVTHAECPECGGTGRRRHPAGLGLRVLREMQARIARSRGRGGLEVRLPRAVREWILRHRAALLREIEASASGSVRVEIDDRLAADGWAMKGLPPAGREETH